MSATETLVATGNQGHSHGPGSPVPLQARNERTTSYDVADFPVPNGREEEWRFTPVKALKALFADEAGTETVKPDVQAPAGVVVETVAPDAVKAGKPQDRVAAVAWKHAEKATAVRIPAEAELSEAIHVNIAGLGGRGFGHLVIEAGRHSRGTVIVDHTGAGELASNVEIVVGDGAELRVVSIQQGDTDSIHVAQHDAVVGRDAKLNHVAVTLGGKVVRLSTNVRYSGPGGDAELLGVYFAESGQHHENRLFVDHEAINCKSNVLYKGALAGDHARSVWIGDVLIRAAAEGTNTFELNRNLVLTDGARADSVPNLEIETGEIEGAGHASATGRFDDEQLFYLQARGIPEDEARRLVVSGFFNDIIAKIGVPEVAEHLHEVIEQKLARTAALTEATNV
ncbi:Fe-S cluster assembly protein SufD [Kribbella orskensis]|uniref:Fe-S cluster assembly protein SufD n=1 Tax=Kribbella orskensis TaxID=2512216 RepID=A0ABY2BGI5_9ACTN|nr:MULTISPECIES: Fe-S cluster assembly protein SufD [Kribbella]TCN37998.1 Fe-S cluster assembly protein SufD [Kribbella sp. VKM Ac-2500]TCO19485.1 Fe-S cluster assembly protein SufD [Kribbella orskensis]